ncbi:MAG: hypothetical protein U0840_31155 [Gemmataceae bacterium]
MVSLDGLLPARDEASIGCSAISPQLLARSSGVRRSATSLRASSGTARSGTGILTSMPTSKGITASSTSGPPM